MEKKDVLLVDDDQSNHFLMERIISSLGFAKKVHSAFNGLEALNLLRAYCGALLEMPQILIVEVHMPVMNGFEFVSALNDINCIHRDKLTIAMVTSSVNPDDQKRARTLGIDHFIMRPVSELKLAAVAGRGYYGL